MATLALVVDVKNRTNSGPWVSALLIAQFLPSIAVGLLFAPLLDRLSRRGTMIAADLARAGIFVGLAFTSRPATIVALAGVAGLATGFFRPAAYAGLPNLVSSEDLSAANSLLQTAENISWAVGPVIGGILVTRDRSSCRPSCSPAFRRGCCRPRPPQAADTFTICATDSRSSYVRKRCVPS